MCLYLVLPQVNIMYVLMSEFLVSDLIVICKQNVLDVTLMVKGGVLMTDITIARYVLRLNAPKDEMSLIRHGFHNREQCVRWG